MNTYKCIFCDTVTPRGFECQVCGVLALDQRLALHGAMAERRRRHRAMTEGDLLREVWS